ncbi:MAG: efflux RND transporter permease subunit [bacterium]|nr:efflux RND transporter permease subunit [bacterium]
MKITQTAIEKNRITAVSLIIIIAAGFMAYQNMSRAEDPGFTIRTAMVMTMFPGASPERVEMLVTDKLEQEIQEMPELKFISSTSKTGVSIIYVNVKQNLKNMRPIWDKLRRKVEAAVPILPGTIIGPFINDEFGDVFGTIITLTGEGFTFAELKDVADDVRDELLLNKEIAKVDIYGGQEERIFVEFDNSRLTELGISPFQLKYILENRNIIIPGGSITTGRERITLEPTGNFESVSELKKTVINLPGRGFIYLEDIANVYRGYIDPPQSKLNSSAIPGLGLAVSMREGGNIIALGGEVTETITRLQHVYPIGIEFDLLSFQPEVVENKIRVLSNSLFQSIGIVLLIMLITLGLRTGLTVASLIPVTILMSFFVMSTLGIGLDQMSIASLIIALGMLVDNSIVMSESILVLLGEGKSRMQAALESASELKIPLLTSSLTTSAAFLPMFLAESDTGEYVANLFKVVTITLLCSWVLSLTMIPWLCYYFLKTKQKDKTDTYESLFYRKYRAALALILRRRLISVVVLVIFFIGTMQLFSLIPNIFFPDKDQNQFTAEFSLPIGTPIERTEEVVEQIEEYIKNNLQVNETRTEGITNWLSIMGESLPRFHLSYNPVMASPELSVMLLNTTSFDIIDDLIVDLEKYVFENFPDVKPTINKLLNGPPITAPVQIRVSGKEIPELFSIVDDVKIKLSEIPGTKNIDFDWGPRTKKIMVRINEPRARRAGVTNLDIALSLQTGLSGFETTNFREDDKVIPITMRSVAEDRGSIDNIESISVFAITSGRSVPLKQVADIEVVWQPAKIFRRDLLKTVTISAYLEDGFTTLDVINKITPWLEEAKNNWEVGYRYEFGGEIEASVEAQESIGVKMPVAFLIIILLLVGQFNSLRKPLIIILTIPMGLIGVVYGLLITDLYLGFMTFMGIVSLTGIVINNAIVLLDRIKFEREVNGLDGPHAVIQACQRRVRPILLTTATTIGGILPLYLQGGPMWEAMAAAIMFGLLFATILTLGFVPVLYSIFYKVNFKGYTYS